jgi:hypothetical protein
LAHFCVFGREKKQKGMKNGMKNDVKNGYHEHHGKEISEKWSKNAFSPPGTLPKRSKKIIFRVHFCKSKARVPFYIHFYFILNFNFEKNGNKMKWKMIVKWTEHASYEQP